VHTKRMIMNQADKKGVFAARRDFLLQTIRQEKGYSSFVVLLCADFEDHRFDFRQESSFYYLSGISEPGSMLLLYDDGYTSLFIPKYRFSRSAWVSGALSPAESGSAAAQRWGVDEILFLGEPLRSASASLLFEKFVYQNILNDLSLIISEGKALCTIGITEDGSYVSQRLLLAFLQGCLPEAPFHEVSEIVHRMRKTKDVEEVGLIHEAIRLTAMAHEAAAKMIEPQVMEYEIQSCIESVFTYFGSGGPAFPSVVAAGKNSTTLHYTARRSSVREGDLVLVDIGALYEHYAADITRTYPASGMFTDRQTEVYSLVLQAQKYIEEQTKPGMFLYNAAEPDKSLHHLAVKFFEYHGCAQYFNHRIGHFLGLDVHDVGDTTEPLQEGDVITIEPGLYLNSEGIGVRIEDDYVVVQDGLLCLSEYIPKSIEEIEDFMNSVEEEAFDNV
jgi:Xaa-Pro aminopeptidase